VKIGECVVVLLLAISIGATGVGTASDLGAKATVGTPASGPLSAEPAGVVVRVEDPCVRGFRVKLGAADATRLSFLGPNGTVLDRRSIQPDTPIYWHNVTAERSLVTNRTYRILVDAEGERYYPGYSPMLGFPNTTPHFSLRRGFWDGSRRPHAYGVFGLVALVAECASEAATPDRFPVATPAPTPSPVPERSGEVSITTVSAPQEETGAPEYVLLVAPVAHLIFARL
jgi:hypothetical protein